MQFTSTKFKQMADPQLLKAESESCEKKNTIMKIVELKLSYSFVAF